jgi:hypothetical protein
VKRFSLKILVMLSLASMIVLAPAWSEPSKTESPQASTPASRLYTEAEVRAAIEIAVKAAVGKAVPEAVREAVAQKESERAAAQRVADWNAAEARRWRRATGTWQGVSLAEFLGFVVYAAVR